MSNNRNSGSGKEAAALRAVDFVRDGQTIGLGSGSTSHLFIRALAEKKYDIYCVATSHESERLAKSVGLSIISVEECDGLDIAIDGADAVDPNKRLIKGYGGALLREKIIAGASREFIVIVDSTKMVADFHGHRIPVEVLPFGHNLAKSRMIKQGFEPVLRLKEGLPYRTDNGNYIYDITSSNVMTPEEVQKILRGIPGILETGLFLNTDLFLDLARKVIIGHEDGTTKIVE